MVEDIFSAKAGARVEIRTGIGRRRQWADEEKGRIVAEAIGPGAVVSEVARRYDLSPQHLFSWIRAAKDGEIALPADGAASFVPVVLEPVRARKARSCEGAASIEIAIGPVKVRVGNGADARIIEAVLRAVRRGAA
jgi:transposase